MRVWYPRSRLNQASKSASRRMVTTVCQVGHTTLVSFQTDAMPRRICASLMWRSLFQSVPASSLAFDVLDIPNLEPDPPSAAFFLTSWSTYDNIDTY